MPSRRFILTTGGAAAVVAVAGTALWAWAPGGAPARAPWRRAGDSFGDPRLDALAFAILAPNPHNRQPWLFNLAGEDRIDVSCDLDRRLPHTDPFDRQITVGFGAMLELLRMAAAEKGYRAIIVLFPDEEPQPRLDGRRVASVTFERDPAVARDPLFTESLKRRTTRAPFDAARPVSDDAIKTLADAAQFGSSANGTNDPERRARLIDIARRGWIVEYETDATRRESIDLMRIGNRAVADNPDGVSLSGTAMGLFKMAGVVSPERLDTPGATAYEQGLSSYLDLIDSAQGFVWLASAANRRADQIAAGRDWVRVNLAAQKIGLAIHPLSQVLQEFPEMDELYQEAHDELRVASPGAVQMLARIGYADFPPPAPRWPLESRIIDANA